MNNRILIADDNEAIHEDFRKILVATPRDRALVEAESVLFGQTFEPVSRFELTSTFQGSEAVEAVGRAKRDGAPFAVAFIDVRMPPGMDGVATAKRLWEVDPHLQIVVCSAYSDHSWSDMTAQLGAADRWVILRKPFDSVEALQLAHALTAKWTLAEQNRLQMAQLELRVQERNRQLLKAMEDLKRETAEHAESENKRRTLERRFEDTQRLESLGVLAGGIAHDFNNILTAILGSASLAKLESTPGSSLDQNLGRIEAGACRAAELCEQMLAYAGKGQVSLQQIDLNAIVKDSLELLHASVPKDAKLEIELAAQLPLVTGDQARMRQVVMNLVINAAEALAGAPRKVRLATSERSLDQTALSHTYFPGDAKPGRYSCIEVTDTGVGMSEDTLRRIFEPFYTTKFTGRGLGLCAVQGIIRARGGALDVQSTQGKGSTFLVCFPAAERTSAGVVPAVPIQTARVPEGTTVIVIDDEQAVLEIASAALRRQGYNVLTAPNGVAAVALLQETSEQIDGVLLDLTMPELDGVSTLHALRALRPGLRAVLMSGYDQQEALRRFDGLGLTGFLQKPFTVQALRDKVGLLRLADRPW